MRNYISHGTFAPGLHNALSMLAGEGRKDILSTSLENGMSSDTYAENVRKCISKVTQDDEIILFGDLIGGSPLTTATNIISEQNLLSQTIIVGGMSLPLVLSAVLMKDDMDKKDLIASILPEARDAMKEFEVIIESESDEI